MTRAFAVLLALALPAFASSADLSYRFIQMYEANPGGQVIRQQPAMGWVVLYGNKTFGEALSTDRGRYRVAGDPLHLQFLDGSSMVLISECFYVCTS